MDTIQENEKLVNDLINIRECPFCGCKPNILYIASLENRSYPVDYWRIVCRNMGCIFKGAHDRSLQQLVKDWNTRSKED